MEPARLVVDVRTARLGLRPEVWAARDDVVQALERLAEWFRDKGLTAEAVGATASADLVKGLKP